MVINDRLVLILNTVPGRNRTIQGNHLYTVGSESDALHAESFFLRDEDDWNGLA